MKLILSLTLSWMLSTPAEALYCYTGWDSTDLQSCNSADEWCATVTTQVSTLDHPPSQITSRSCQPSSVCALQVPKIDRRKNGLQCDSCTDAKGNLGVCNNPVQCVGVEDRCISGTLMGDREKRTLPYHGCISANVCDLLSQLKNGSILANPGSFTSAPTCCKTSFCNSAWTVRLTVSPLLLGLVALIVTHC
ncbi:phospholipase A2 inhibitor and Ly6/PLAUR domain-containing protein-like protein [Lates japonicus]|uniref:Phospholipase A2 inhibitor and Ly6/PLAUR domain-containing protein-like protein n=1 Tax=Lates japonicus TaxID=270547 RepID=A0AAD3N9F3_LATJO|nr:phospholipase A2 inhibitor and Ly6/PLAUR domain-containing protein-like protein [Lates japonicus]